MDISTNIAPLWPSAPAVTPEQAVQAKVPVDPAVQGESSTKIEARVVPVAVSAAEKNKAKNQKDLDQAVIKLNDFVQNLQRDLQFSVDEKSGEMVVKVIDTTSQKVIRQIPSEDALKLARSLMEQKDNGKLTIFRSTA
jgi:flagellar protein FlaG